MAQVKDIYGKERGTRVRTNGYVPARNVLDELDKQNEKKQLPVYNPASLLSLNQGPISARTADALVSAGKAAAEEKNGQIHLRPVKQTPGSTAPAVILKTTFQAEKTAAKETAENRKASGGDAFSTAADFLDNFVQGGFDRFMSGAYGLAAMADEAVTNPLNKGLYKITGNEKYGQEYVSPLRWNSNVYAEDAENILQKTSEGRSDLGKKVMSTGQAAGNLVFGGLVTGAASPAIKTAQAAVGIQQAAGLGASSTAQAATTIRNSAATLANRLLQSPTNTLVSLGSTGSAYVDAATRGAPREKAIQNAVLAGVAEFESNRLFGGTPLEDASKKGYVTKLGEHIAEKVGKSSVLNDFMRTGAGKAVGWSTEKAGEGIEEVVTGFLAPVFERITWNPKADLATVDELWNQFEDGVALSLLMSGGQAVVGKANAIQQWQNPVVETVNPETAKPVRAGRATTIYNPYQGAMPVQTHSTGRIVEVPESAVQRAQDYTRQAQTATETTDGKGFKTILTRLYQSTFRKSEGVPVFEMTFRGEPYLVEISNRVPGKVISDRNFSTEKIALLDILPEIVKNGEYIGSGEYGKHGTKAKPVIRYDYFETPVTIGGKEYVARFDVEALPDTNNYRTHQIKDVDLLTPEGSLVGPSAYGSLKQSKSTTTNIPNLPNVVNPISGTPHDYAALLAELARERGGAKTLTPEQRRELEAWNSAFPELRMSEEEFLSR